MRQQQGHPKKNESNVDNTMNNLLLPITYAKDIILEKCAHHGTVILVGETGSGKTTQVPQYLMERRTFGGRVAVTQPRRVAAMSVARRVAYERKCTLGHLVGYTIRFDDKTCKKTRLRYMTDGMLLREAMLDPKLLKYSVIILDEAHERSLNTDILFGVVKMAQVTRKDTNMPLRLVVMSATLDVQRFLDFFTPTDLSREFDKPVAIHVSGRQFPVQVMYTNVSQQDYVDASVTTVLQLHKQEPPGDILVFLTGQEEIEAVAELIDEKAQSLKPEDLKLEVCPIFAALPASEQMKVFLPASENARKVVLATNIAETSITISGIRYVVDPGMVKMKSFSAASGVELLKVVPISQEQAWQRTGRAGREAPGKCFRLYCEKDFLKLSSRSVPEILRVELSQVMIQLMVLGIENIIEFDFIEPPGKEALKQALFKLLALEAVEIPSLHADALKNPDAKTTPHSPQPKLTALGAQIASLPLEPMHAKFLLDSVKFKCSKEALTIAAMLSVESPFYVPRQSKREATTAHKRFLSFEADHLTLLNTFVNFEQAGMNKKWCTANFLKYNTLVTAKKVRTQLESMLLHALGKKDDSISELFSSEGETVPILKCLVSAFALQAARRVPSTEQQQTGVVYKTFSNGMEVKIHPSSSLSRRDPMPNWLIFNELVMTSKKYIRGIACVEQNWLSECAPAMFSKVNISEGTVKRRVENAVENSSSRTPAKKRLLCD